MELLVFSMKKSDFSMEEKSWLSTHLSWGSQGLMTPCLYDDQDYPVVVVTDQEKNVIAWALKCTWGGSTVVNRFVDPKYRNLGIAKLMKSKMEG